MIKSISIFAVISLFTLSSYAQDEDSFQVISREVDVVDEINHINLDTGSAAGGFQAPWTITGNISAPDETRRKFDLLFSFTVGEPGEIQEASMRLYGQADFADAEFPLPGSRSIDDWELSWRNEGDAVPGQANTLDELRELLKKD